MIYEKKLVGESDYLDALTGLPNKKLFYDRLTQALAFAGRNKKIMSVIFLSINNLKLINDTIGHDFGDACLQSIAERLRECLRKSDTIARPGRDEFMILLTEITHAEDAALVAQKIFSALDSPFCREDHELFITANIGISIYPHDGYDALTLIQNSYTAMQTAGKFGKNIYKFFSRSMNDRAFERMVLATSLRHALKREEFLLHYQPQIDLHTGHIRGMEALIRWERPGTGTVYPGSFINLLEETGLIVPVGEWVLETACRQFKAWQEAGLGPVRMAVNISARQFHQQDMVETVSRTLKATGLDPQYLELELTESVFMHDLQNAIEVLQRLKGMEIRFAIDDFGTGYSSLSYLKYFPADRLKIVEPLISYVAENPCDVAIAKAIVEMAHSLNMKVVAEGVEKDEQLLFLRSLKCDLCQGNIFSRPLAAGEMMKLLAEKKHF